MILNYVPDECSDYLDGYKFNESINEMRITHFWCPETQQMQPPEHFSDKVINKYWNDIGGEG